MILVDPRFGSERKGQRASHRIVAELLPKLGIETYPQQLTSADFAFLGNGPEAPLMIGVELKMIGDFVTSLRSGRVTEQVLEMAHDYGRSYLVIQGVYRARTGSGILEIPRGNRWRPINAGPRPVFWTEVERGITSLEEAGVRVRWTRTEQQTAAVIAHVLYAFWNKKYDDHTSLRGAVRPAPLSLVREDEVTKRVRQVAACLPGIGWTRSKKVAERFGSITGLVNGSVEEWESIDGIGKSIARDVHRSVHERIPEGRVPARRGTAPRSVRPPRYR